MSNTQLEILGVVNITRDSFSDGGRYLDPANAVIHALRLVAEGASIVDLGAESTHPDAEPVSAEEEIDRLSVVVRELRKHKVRLSVDTYKPSVMRAMLALGVEIINDVTGCKNDETLEALADCDARVICMHSTAARAKADRKTADPTHIVDQIVAFFEDRLAALSRAGVREEQIILDPGLGFFIGANPDASIAVLRGLDRLLALGRPLCIAASRKSFIGAILESQRAPRPVEERSVGSLAVELWAARRGAAYIRTHEPRPLRDALKMLAALDGE